MANFGEVFRSNEILKSFGFTPPDKNEIIKCRKKAVAATAKFTSMIRRGDIIHWKVDKVTPLKTLPSSIKSPPELNVCSPFTFLEEEKCDSISYSLAIKEHGERVMLIKAKSNKDGSTVEFRLALQIVDDSHYIFQGRLSNMKIFRGSISPESIPAAEIPLLATVTQEQLFALVDRHPDEKWEIYSTCRGHTTWSAIMDSELSAGDVATMQAEIDEALEKHKEIPISSMISIYSYDEEM